MRTKRTVLLVVALGGSCLPALQRRLPASESEKPSEAATGLRLEALDAPCEVLERVDVSVEGIPPVENPFDPAEITVDAAITDPSGGVQRLPGYYHRDFTRRLEGGREVLTPSGAGGWRVRFTPRERGEHRVEVRVDRKGDPQQSEPLVGSLRIDVKPGERAGFVRLQPRGNRYFRLDDGSPLFLNGICCCWHDARGTYDYDDWLAAYQKNGMNYIRIWMWHHAFGIEWDSEDRTRYRLDAAWTVDRVLEEADRRGIYVMLCFDYHGILETKPDFWGGNNFWPRHPYNAANGGPCRTQNDFFTNEEARRLYQKRLRYMVARWTAFTNILAWQFFNEIDNVYRYLEHDDVVAWHRDMARFLRALDPYDHLITTSLTGRSDRPGIWKLPELDFAQYHSYNEKHPADVTLKVVRGFHERYEKPVFVGEYGTDFRGWKPDTDPHLRALHQAIWSGAFSGAAGTGMSWWWQGIHRAGRYQSWASLSSFLEGTGIGGADWEPLRVAVTRKEGAPEVQVLGVGSPDEAIVWLLDARYSWPEGAMEDDPQPCAGVEVGLSGLEEGAYRVEWWQPIPGKIGRQEELEASGGKLRLTAPEFRMDLAARLSRVDR